MTRKMRRALYREALAQTSGKYRTTQATIEKAIPDPPDYSIMTWGPAYGYDAVAHAFSVLEFKGSKKVVTTVPSWYRTVRTDTTDRLGRNKASAFNRRETNI